MRLQRITVRDAGLQRATKVLAPGEEDHYSTLVRRILDENDLVGVTIVGHGFTASYSPVVPLTGEQKFTKVLDLIEQWEDDEWTNEGLVAEIRKLVHE